MDSMSGLLGRDNALANMRHIAVACRTNLLCGQSFDRECIAIEGHELDLEGFAVAMRMNDDTDIASFETR